MRLFVPLVRRAEMRPADLVGATANVAGVFSKNIGAIELGDNHSTVEVPGNMADQIIDALREPPLRGRKVNVRRDRA